MKENTVTLWLYNLRTLHTGFTRMNWFVCTLLISAVLAAYPAVSVTEIDDDTWNSWLAWTECSVTCGTGFRVRSRVCGNDVSANQTSNSNCTGQSYDVESCHLTGCRVDGAWGSWLSWLPCTLTCGLGVRYRSRECNNPAPAFNGSDCVGDKQDFGTCITAQCPVDGAWTNWGTFGPCSKTCGIDVLKTRERNCSNPEPVYGGKDCDGNSTDVQLCDYVDCKDGTWSVWESWGQCSRTCGASVRFRNRTCQPSPSNGTCAGYPYDYESCNISCPVDGIWSSWLDWSSCKTSCENGTKTRERQCTNPAPAHGGKNCSGVSLETTSCFVSVVCPIDGNWASWQSWSQCDRSCNTGHRVRLRECSNPAPKFNGSDCAGDFLEKDTCTLKTCPVDGGWTDWLPWGKCSVICGTGTQSRVRLCTNPKPEFGGEYCTGNVEESRICSIGYDAANCSVDGNWASWNTWGECSATCGAGVSNRNRTCTNPAPHGNGTSCAGDRLEFRNCTAGTSCPVDGGWSSWRDWLPCSVTCGNGTQSRARTCTNPKPEHGGSYCNGNNLDSFECQLSPCGGGTGVSELVG